MLFILQSTKFFPMIEKETSQLAFSGEGWTNPELTPEDFKGALQRIDKVEVVRLDGAGYISHAFIDESGQRQYYILIDSQQDAPQAISDFPLITARG